MSASVFTRRRSERLAQLIEEAGGPRRHHARSHARSGLDDELAELVSVGRRLREMPLSVEAEPEFRDGLRAMLMATIEREGIGATAVHPASELAGTPIRGLLGSRRARTRTAVIAGVAVGTMALSGMSAASGDAIPGSALYGVKRSTERAQLALAGSDTSRGQLNFQFARTRLDEASAFRNDPARLAAVFDDMDTETRQGVRMMTASAVDRRNGADLDSIDSFAGAQRQGLNSLRDVLTGPARERADASLSLLDAVQRRSTGLRPILPCGTAATTATDLLGPIPTLRCKVNPQGAAATSAPTKGAGSGAARGNGNSGGTDTASGQIGAQGGQNGTAANGTAANGTASNGASVEAGASSAPVLPGDPTVPSPSPGILTDGGGLLGGVNGLGGILGEIAK